MGCFDGAEICELVGLFILHKLTADLGKEYVGLYRDDGLVLAGADPAFWVTGLLGPHNH